MLIYDVLANEIWFMVRSFRYAIWLGLERSIARVKVTTIKTVHRRHAEEQLQNQLIALSELPTLRPGDQETSRCAKQNKRLDG